jgi:hypothetical protein
MVMSPHIRRVSCLARMHRVGRRRGVRDAIRRLVRVEAEAAADAAGVDALG